MGDVSNAHYIARLFNLMLSSLAGLCFSRGFRIFIHADSWFMNVRHARKRTGEPGIGVAALRPVQLGKLDFWQFRVWEKGEQSVLKNEIPGQPDNQSHAEWDADEHGDQDLDKLPRFGKIIIGITNGGNRHSPLSAENVGVISKLFTLGLMVKNVLGTALQTCCTNPLTGFYRDGKCNTGPDDHGQHTICVNLTDAFLRHQRQIGNDLITPRPEYGFPGLKAGDHWCVCIERWKESFDAGIVASARLEATHERALEYVSMEMLLKSADMGNARVN